MKTKKNNRFLAVVGMILVIIFLTTGCITSPKQYTTTDIADYGHYEGNYNNQYPNEFINSFFPQKIDKNFSRVNYSYRAQKADTYAFEAVLEFVIEDTDEYNTYVEEKLAHMKSGTFQYDSSFNEYLISDELRVFEEPDSQGQYHIGNAKIGKILCCPEEQRIIYVALCVYDGGIVTTDFLNVYFNRFQINPLTYSG